MDDLWKRFAEKLGEPRGEAPPLVLSVSHDSIVECRAYFGVFGLDSDLEDEWPNFPHDFTPFDQDEKAITLVWVEKDFTYQSRLSGVLEHEIAELSYQPGMPLWKTLEGYESLASTFEYQSAFPLAQTAGPEARDTAWRYALPYINRHFQLDLRAAAQLAPTVVRSIDGLSFNIDVVLTDEWRETLRFRYGAFERVAKTSQVYLTFRFEGFRRLE